MSQDFMLRILTRVSRALADNDDDALAAMLATTLEPLRGRSPIIRHGTLPRFGDGLSYDATRFSDLSGVAVSKGMLMVGIECQNAWRPYRDVDEDARHPVESRLDRVLARLSAISEGPPGEVAGCVANEEDPRFFDDGGKPILRCRDGVLRRAWVDHDHGDHAASHGVEPEPRTPLPIVIPAEAITPEDGPNLEATLDVAMLRRRYAILDLEPTRLVEGPARPRAYREPEPPATHPRLAEKRASIRSGEALDGSRGSA